MIQVQVDPIYAQLPENLSIAMTIIILCILLLPQIKSCDVCQRNNYKLHKTSASLHPIPIKSEVWNQLGMDLIGPLRQTQRGNKYIITVIDYYSKWAEAGPLKDKTAASVAEFLYSVSLVASSLSLPAN